MLKSTKHNFLNSNIVTGTLKTILSKQALKALQKECK